MNLTCPNQLLEPGLHRINNGNSIFWYSKSTMVERHKGTQHVNKNLYPLYIKTYSKASAKSKSVQVLYNILVSNANI